MLVGRCSKMRVISAVRVALERGLGFLLLTFFLGRLRASLFLLYKILESVQFDQRHVFQVQLEALRHVALADQSAQLQQICVLQILYPGSQFSFLCDGYEAFGLALGLLRQGGKWAGLRSGLGDSPLDRFGLGAANHNGFEFQLFVISFKILGDLEEVCVGSVEEVAVFEDELDIRVELSNREIFALVQVNSNRLQIHRIFYQLCVVRDPHGYRVHRLQKRPRVLILPQLKQDFLRPSDHLVVAEGVQGLRMRSSHAHLRYIFLFLLGNHAGVFGEPVALFTRCGFAVFSSAIYLQGVVGGEQSGDGGRLRYGQGETERLARTVLCEEALRWVLAVLPEGLGAQILIHALQILYTV